MTPSLPPPIYVDSKGYACRGTHPRMFEDERPTEMVARLMQIAQQKEAQQ